MAQWPRFELSVRAARLRAPFEARRTARPPGLSLTGRRRPGGPVSGREIQPAQELGAASRAPTGPVSQRKFGAPQARSIGPCAASGVVVPIRLPIHFDISRSGARDAGASQTLPLELPPGRVSERRNGIHSAVAPRDPLNRQTGLPAHASRRMVTHRIHAPTWAAPPRAGGSAGARALRHAGSNRHCHLFRPASGQDCVGQRQ